jgi:GAF domain-containing protein
VFHEPQAPSAENNGRQEGVPPQTADSEEAKHRQEVLHVREEKERMEQALTESHKRVAMLAQRCAWAEHQAGHIARMYTAVCQLNEARTRADGLQSILEIVVNFLGSEEVGIYEAPPGAGALVLANSIGLDKDLLGRVELGSGLIGRSASSGAIYLASQGGGTPLPHELTLTACVPLRHPQGVVGAIAIFRLLPQKPALDPEDHDLLEMLSSQAAATVARGLDQAKK